MADMRFTMLTLVAAFIVYTTIQIAFIPTDDDSIALFRRSTYYDYDAAANNLFSLDTKPVTLRRTKSASEIQPVISVGADGIGVNNASLSDRNPSPVISHVMRKVSPPEFLANRQDVSLSPISDENRNIEVNVDSRKSNVSQIMAFLSVGQSKERASLATRQQLKAKGEYPEDSFKCNCSYLDILIRKSKQDNRKRNSLGTFVQDGIFWSESIESALPPDVTEEAVRAWRDDVRMRRVVRLLPGCGRERNRLAILDNGEKLCCRYRQNFEQIQGEIVSFHLARILGIANVPLSVLLEVDSISEQWISVQKNVTKAGWKDGFIIVATKWISDLEPAYMPAIFRGRNCTFGVKNLIQSTGNLGLDDLSELIQWSDLILFDYVTANLDRIVNTYVNLQWNKFIFERPVHNLQVSTSDNRLIFLDNESGMLHGYRLLSQYSHYHEKILKSVCLFRLETVTRLFKLDAEGNVWHALLSLMDREEPLFEKLPSFPPKYRQVLRERVGTVVEHVKECYLLSL